MLNTNSLRSTFTLLYSLYILPVIAERNMTDSEIMIFFGCDKSVLLIKWPRTIHHSGNLLFESFPVVQRLSHCSYYRFTAYMKQLTHKAHSLSADVLRRPALHISHHCGSWLCVTSATDSRKEADSSSGVLEKRLLGRYEGLFVLFTDDWSMTPWFLIIGQSSCHLWEALGSRVV